MKSFEWSNIIGLEIQKEILQELVQTKEPTGVLLYGAPGTGKTLLAQALESPSVVHFENLDCEKVHKVHKAIESGLVVLGSNSEPWMLPDSVLKLFGKRVYIPLPGPVQRKSLIKLCIQKYLDATEEQLQELAELSETFSPKEILAVVEYSIKEPVRKCHKATHFRPVEDGGYEPCSPSSSDALQMSLGDLPEGTLNPPKLTYRGFLSSFVSFKPTEKNLNMHYKFTEESERFGY